MPSEFRSTMTYVREEKEQSYIRNGQVKNYYDKPVWPNVVVIDNCLFTNGGEFRSSHAPLKGTYRIPPIVEPV